jgi:hypothetical protein
MSNETLYYLGASTLAEPLVYQWAAWSHLLAPLPSSLHLEHYQISILQNYLNDPSVHVKACRDPNLRSGPFVDIPIERADEVRQLLADTESSQHHRLQFAHSFVEFYSRLVREAEGQSLEPYYDNLPPNLRGCVELNYDYYHRPMVRLFENLLYEGPYYDQHLQSLRLFQEERDDTRPFFMNTPRLPQEKQIDWTVPFASPAIDEFFALEDTPQTVGSIRELLGLSVVDDARLLPLLATERKTAPPEKWNGAAARIRYMGHACVLIEWNGVAILTDPCVAVMPTEGGIDRFTYWDLPEKIDYVLVTHGHHDHFCIETLLRLRRKIGCLVVPRSHGVLYGDISLKLLAQKLGFRNVVELEALESIELPDGAIIGVPFLGEHADLLHGKSAYVVRAGREQVLFAADSDCLDERIYENVCRTIGPIQTVFIGMECVGAPLSWSCGPFFPVQPKFNHEQSRRYKGCDSERAHRILEAVGAEHTFVYAMGLEPWLEYLLGLALTDDSPQIIESNKYLARAREKGFADAELLFGRVELLLDHSPADGYALQAVEKRAMAAGHEDQFAFD